MELSGESSPGTDQPSDPSQESAELVWRARRGDEAAWEALVHQHQEPVFRLAYLFLGDRDEAEDVAQETFIRAYLALERFDVARPMRPWLLSICANLARNRRRSIGRFFNAVQKLIREEPQPQLKEGNGLEIRWQSQTLWSAVQRLGQNDQQIVYLRYFLELTVDETAEALGVAVGTVKSRLHRALERLRRVIEREYPDLKDLWA
jgi:RNA polymerase sigma-70 factor (ECF subfamily)